MAGAEEPVLAGHGGEVAGGRVPDLRHARLAEGRAPARRAARCRCTATIGQSKTRPQRPTCAVVAACGAAAVVGAHGTPSFSRREPGACRRAAARPSRAFWVLISTSLKCGSSVGAASRLAVASSSVPATRKADGDGIRTGMLVTSEAVVAQVGQPDRLLDAVRVLRDRHRRVFAPGMPRFPIIPSAPPQVLRRRIARARPANNLPNLGHLIGRKSTRSARESRETWQRANGCTSRSIASRASHPRPVPAATSARRSGLTRDDPRHRRHAGVVQDEEHVVARAGRRCGWVGARDRQPGAASRSEAQRLGSAGSWSNACVAEPRRIRLTLADRRRLGVDTREGACRSGPSSGRCRSSGAGRRRGRAASRVSAFSWSGRRSGVAAARRSAPARPAAGSRCRGSRASSRCSPPSARFRSCGFPESPPRAPAW